jgi:uncharacterized protein YndB with AHSA1/START domain
MTSQSDVVVQVDRRFDASCERVFDAWLDPGTLGHWMFGPEVRDEEIVRLDVDARVGGKFSFVVRRGNEQLDHVGEYEGIDRPRRLGFTWAAHAVGDSADEASSHVSIEITPRSDGCELVLTHKMDRKWADYADRTHAGWTTMLEALDRHLATNR